MKLEDLCLTSQQTILPPVRQASDSLFQTTLLFSRLTMLGRRSNNPSVQETAVIVSMPLKRSRCRALL